MLRWLLSRDSLAGTHPHERTAGARSWYAYGVSEMTETHDWDADPEQLARLREEPSGQYPPPPVHTVAYELPLGAIPWEDFEKLCERLARLAGDTAGARRYARSGQRQEGIDIYGVRPNGRYRVWQMP